MTSRQALTARRAAGRLPAWLLNAAIEALLIGAIALLAFIALGIVGNPWYRVVAIRGASMEPTISAGDLIVVRPAPATIEPGMVVVMTIGSRTVTHRVVAVNANGTLVTRGDANPVNDDWHGQPAHISGLYVATIPWVGTILPVPQASHALFRDEVAAAMHITVGPFTAPPPTPAECSGMTFSQVLVGTPGDDQFQAANGGALIFGLGGNDTISGGNGKDCLVGGDGDDLLIGSNGKDVLLGEDGNDILVGGGDNDIADGGNGRDRLDGGDGTDACIGTRKDTYLDCESIGDGRAAPVTDGSSQPEAPISSPTGVPAPSGTDSPAPSPATTPSPAPTAIPTAAPSATDTPSATPAATATATP